MERPEPAAPFPMKIWLIEPYLTGSHQGWAEGYQAHSRHQVRLLALPGRFWKWRMQGGAITLARRAALLDERPDLILASDMLNVPVFLALGGEGLARVPMAIYFHENQLTYPLPRGAKRDLDYGFINLASALLAKALMFNSEYHRAEFLAEVPRLLKHFPDYNELWAVEALRAKAQVLPLGLDLAGLDSARQPWIEGPATVLWNHRWEYDKNPAAFFQALYALADEGLDFRVVLLGESFRNEPSEFLEARRTLGERIIHFGYAEGTADYARWLWQADIVVSTAIHEFFGAAVVEACYCGCFPLLPRRLSYPELIPAELHAACLYTDDVELVARLRQAIKEVARARTGVAQAHMARYDWRNMAPVYDACMEATAQGEGAPAVG